MCTQELVWCSCGHGEFLPIQKCSRATSLSLCWIVVHGDYRVVLPGKCSYCLAGLNEKKQLLSPRPEGWLASKIEEGNAEPKIDPLLLQDISMADQTVERRNGSALPVCESGLGDPLPEMEGFDFEDVLSTDFSKEFNLCEELWQYL